MCPHLAILPLLVFVACGGPEGVGVVIEPANPTSSDDLVAVVTAGSLDGERLRVVWSREGERLTALGAVVPAHETRRGVVLRPADHRGRRALEDRLQRVVEAPVQPSRPLHLGLHPLARLRSHPVRRAPRHDAQSAVRPEPTLALEPVRRHHDGEQLRRAYRTHARTAPHEPELGMLLRFGQHRLLRLALQPIQRIDLLVQQLGQRLGRPGKSTQVLAPLRGRVNPAPGHGHPARAVQGLQSVLHPHPIAPDPPVALRVIAQGSEPATFLVDRPLDRAQPEPLRQAEGIPSVVLRAPALAHRRHHHLLRVGRQHLVQPLRQRPFLQADVPRFRDLSHRFDQAPCVRLHHVASNPLPARHHDPQRAA